FKRLFHGAIIRKCQSSFETTALSQFQETANKIQNEIKEEEQKEDKDEKKLTELNDRLEDLQVKEKRRMLGTIKFISHLFRIGLLNYKIIENCIVILIRNAEQDSSELMAEYAVDLMKHVGPYIVQRKEDTSKLDGYVTYLDKFKPTVSNRVKFMIIDLAELRDKKWMKKGDGPKTKDEVDQQRLGSTKKWGNANANVNTNTPSGNNKPAPRVIARQSNDARQNSNDVRKSGIHKENKPAVAPTPKIDSRSASTTPPPTDPSSSRSQNNTPTVTPETEFNKGAFKTGFKERLQSFLDGTNVDEIAKSLIEFSNELNNPVVFLEQMFSYCCEHLKKTEEKERHAVSQLVVKCFQDPALKNAFSPAFKKYCKYLVQEDIEGDVPHLKTTFPEFVAHLMATANSVPSSALVEGFKEFHECDNYMFARTFAEFGRILTKRNDDLESLGWIFEEFSNADPHYKSDEMQQILAKQLIDYDENHKNLKELIVNCFLFVYCVSFLCLKHTFFHFLVRFVLSFNLSKPLKFLYWSFSCYGDTES
uniref:MIF4G domain-containing protein n=1 Tax=Panagrolaimus sp. ES5 TaxID=591445 RepID=A0AC34FLS9_9BILA